MFSLNLIYVDYIFVLIIISALITLFFVFKKTLHLKEVRFIFFIRLFLFSILIFLLLEPKLILNKSRSFQKDWNLYIDNSLSMAYHKNSSSLSITKGINELIEKLKVKGINIIPFTFGSELDTNYVIDKEIFFSSSTNIEQVIDHIEFNQQKISGAIIITDGQVNSGNVTLSNDFNLDIPIHSIGVGNEIPLVDVSIQSVEIPPAILKGDNIDLKVIISSIGDINERLNVMIYSEGKILGSKVISVVGNGSLNHVRFRIKPEATGEINYLIKVNSAPEEINIKNNSQKIKTQVLKSEYSIALFTGSPNFNTSIIKRILEDNNTYNIDHFIFKNGNYSKPLNYFWDKKYDLILFDNHPVNDNFNDWVSFLRIFIKKIISNQTSIGFFNGFDIHQETIQKYLSLVDVELNKPLIELNNEFDWSIDKNWDSFFPLKKIKIERIDLNNLPPLFVNIEVDSSNLIPLAKFNLPEVKIPLLMVGEKKNIRFLIWSSPELYKLYFNTQNTNLNSIDKQIFNPLFSWLMRTGSGENFYFRSDKNSYQQGEKIIISGKSIYDDNQNLDGIINIYYEDELVNSKPIIYNKDLGIYEGYFYASKPGELDYAIEFLNEKNQFVSKKNTIQIQESQVELNKVYLDNRGLNLLAKKTNGDFYFWDNRNEFANVLEKNIKNINVKYFKKFIMVSWFFVALFLLLGIEWYIRNKKGFS